MTWAAITNYVNQNWDQLLRILFLLGIGFPLVVGGGHLVRRWVGARFASHYALIAGKATLYAGLLFLFISLLGELGFSIAHLWGTAGVLGVAVAFASQTSVSNIISGLFLMTEKSFVVGDVISVAGVTGEILSIDSLSLKLRTFQNQLVRIPNETMIKSEVTNLTRFPIRRVDLQIGVAYREELKKVREVLMQVAEKNPLCLSEPTPGLMLTGFGDSAVEMLFVVWATTPNWALVRNQLTEAVKVAFDREGIEIPFPHLSLYRGSVSEPFDVQLTSADPSPEDPAAENGKDAT